MADETRETRELLELRIADILENIQHAKGDELKTYKEVLAVLLNAKNEMEKNDFDYDDKYNRRVMEDAHFDAEMEMKQKEMDIRKEELEFKKLQEKNQNKRAWIALGGTLGGTALTGGIVFIIQHREQIFEQTNIPTTSILKSLLSKIVPKL